MINPSVHLLAFAASCLPRRRAQEQVVLNDHRADTLRQLADLTNLAKGVFEHLQFRRLKFVGNGVAFQVRDRVVQMPQFR